MKPGAADVRVAVLSGSELRPPTPDVLAYLRQTQADVFIVLGGLGRSDAHALETARALSSLERMVVMVRGGSDSFDHALPEVAATVIDGSAVRSVRIGSDSLLLWPGADQGRYSLSATSCGFAEAELQAALDELGPLAVGERRWLLSWQAPDPGSPLAAFATRAGASGVVYAWPPSASEIHGRAWNSGPSQLVPRAWGPKQEGLDGRQLTLGATLLRFDHEGPHDAR